MKIAHPVMTIFILRVIDEFLWPLTITTYQNLWLVQLAIASFQNQ
jgi:ABC-type glycerol-3-phosphate transport system permease component